MADFAGPFTGFTLFYETEEETVAPLPIPGQAAPTVACAPETQVGNGGKGNAGCNMGGIGLEWPETCS